MIDGLTNAGALPVLERLVQFTGGRHRLIIGNIANLDTPGYRPVDVSPQRFQEQLGEAIDHRRSDGGDLRPQDTTEVEFTPSGMVLNPQAAGENILFHDGNDRDLERTMQHLAENFMTFRLASELYRSRLNLINTAISERI